MRKYPSNAVTAATAAAATVVIVIVQTVVEAEQCLSVNRHKW